MTTNHTTASLPPRHRIVIDLGWPAALAVGIMAGLAVLVLATAAGYLLSVLF